MKVRRILQLVAGLASGLYIAAAVCELPRTSVEQPYAVDFRRQFSAPTPTRSPDYSSSYRASEISSLVNYSAPYNASVPSNVSGLSDAHVTSDHSNALDYSNHSSSSHRLVKEGVQHDNPRSLVATRRRASTFDLPLETTRGLVQAVSPRDISIHHDNPRPTENDSCGYPRLTLKLWESGLREQAVEWVASNAKDFIQWRSESSENDMTFEWYLVEAWTNLDSVGKCNGDFCDLVSCENMIKGQDPERTKIAFYALGTIMRWHNDQVALRKDWTDALSNVQMRIETLIDDFTDTNKLVEALHNHEMRIKRILHLVLTAVLIAASAIAFINPAITAAAAGGGGILASTAFRELVGVYSAESNVLAGSYAGLAALSLDSDRWRNNPWEDLRMKLGNIFGDLGFYISSGMQNDTMRVLRGLEDSHGQNLLHVVAAPSWITVPPKDVDQIGMIETQLTKMVINFLWSQQWVYIVEANSYSCANDYRIWDKLKSCLSQYPGNIYQLLFIGQERESTPFHYAELRGPPGWQKLGTGDYKGITLDEVVAVSKQNFDSQKYMSNDDETDFRMRLGNPRNYPMGGPVISMWTVPLLRSPHGEALSSIMETNSRHYPLLAGSCRWNGEITADCNEETRQFLEVTGLYKSEQYRRACCDWGVKRDHSENTTWYFNDKSGGPEYSLSAITRIGKTGDHETWGHEDPKDDGREKHHDGKWGYCDGDHFEKHHRFDLDPPCKPPMGF